MKKSLSLLAAILVSGAAQAQGKADAVIRIGQTADYSGPQSGPVKETTNAARAYFAMVNAKGGVNGRKIELESLDDGFEPKRSVENAKKLIDEKNVLALFLFRGTANAEAVMPVILEKKVPMFAGVGSSKFMHDPPNRYLFNLRAPVQVEVATVVSQLVAQGAHNVAVVYTDDGFGKDAVGGAKAAFEKNKIEPKAIVSIPRGATDVDEAVKAIVKAQPAMTLGFCIPKICATIVQKLRAAKSITQFVSLSNTSSSAYVKELGEFSKGVMVTQVMPYPFEAREGASRDFLQFSRESKIAPSYAAMEGWLSARVLVDALKKAGNNPTRESLTTAFENLDVNYGGFPVRYGGSNRTGSTFVEITMIGKDGRFIR